MVDFFQCSASEGGVGSVGLSLIFSEVEQGAGRLQEKAREEEKTAHTGHRCGSLAGPEPPHSTPSDEQAWLSVPIH